MAVNVNSLSKCHRVLVIVNKDWECDAVIGVLLNRKARPNRLNFQPPTKTQKDKEGPQLRLVINLSTICAEIWCISDLMTHLGSNLQSSTEHKQNNIGRIFEDTYFIHEEIILSTHGNNTGICCITTEKTSC